MEYDSQGRRAGDGTRAEQGASSVYGGNALSMLPPNFGMEQGAGGGFLFVDGNHEAASTHEGLQVYTVGHLMPRQQGGYPGDEAGMGELGGSGQGDWNFDPASLVLPPQAREQEQQGERRAVYGPERPGQQGVFEATAGGGGSEDDEEEEVVRPSINTTDENGVPVAVQAPPPVSPRGASPAPGSPRRVASPPGKAGAGPSAVAKGKGKGPAAGVLVSAAEGGSKKLRVRRSTFVPGWAVPPKVLLVDDDAISRKLGSKFLQVFGCTTDVAVDGVSAVTKMNLEQYDLVLMDIVMPKLDGVSATSMIRKFDQGTPIISMTSNSKPNEIMTYYSSGMNDILPKPFSKQGLFDMLEKHLNHLKTIQQMSRSIARGPGIPPLSDQNFEQALAQNASGSSTQLALPGPSSAGPSTSGNRAESDGGNNGGSSSSNTDVALNAPSPFNMNAFFSMGPDQGDEARINPLAGMGLTDEQYTLMVTNLMNGESFMGGLEMGTASTSGASSPGGYGMGMGGAMKRSYEEMGELDGGLDAPQGKKSRFEVIE
ncbi:hypothetical protein DFP72DRAFT_910498 [Ephemerocybe angulata]|uniref:Response regulatory domain-containing protein n=1 Tax=Ephemerocybe angulata TaxID=980116 RepID=A0A8H6HRH3_9AGAR|nr:hypothetical protein DFP72DRAFT_910498 [Tulosesus angulatus]